MHATDAIVIGGGLVGTAIGYGLARRGARVILLDEGDVALRASRGNFGLVWVQGKGATMPEYATWTRRSAGLWPGLAAALAEDAGVDVQLEQPGGLSYCLTDAELQERADLMRRMSNVHGPDLRYEILDRRAAEELTPGIGPDVVGACYCEHDGAVNSLRLYRGLVEGLRARGGRYLPGRRVDALAREGGGFSVRAGAERFAAAKVVIAAGHGSPRLAPMVGLAAPISPERGQVLVTARVRRFLSYPTHLVRQTGEGSVLLGDSKEDVGFDDRTTPGVTRAIARRAVAIFPRLRAARVVRTWGALRVMSPDGHPVYEQSESCPGAFVACVHSGVTLAAAHAGPLADAIADGALPPEILPFTARRFGVPARA